MHSGTAPALWRLPSTGVQGISAAWWKRLAYKESIGYYSSELYIGLIKKNYG